MNSHSAYRNLENISLKKITRICVKNKIVKYVKVQNMICCYFFRIFSTGPVAQSGRALGS